MHIDPILRANYHSKEYSGVGFSLEERKTSQMSSEALKVWSRLQGSCNASKIGLLTFASVSILYGMFQKKMLPQNVSTVVSKLMFFPTLPFTYLQRVGNLFTEVDSTVILGTAPLQLLGHPKELYSRGVRGVVNMCSEYAGPQAAYRELGIKQLRLPTTDHFEPSLQSLTEAVRFIEDCKARGDKVYIHCKAGHGRAAAVTLAWLLHSNKDRSAQELNLALWSKRKVRKTLWQQPNIQAFEQQRDSRDQMR